VGGRYRQKRQSRQTMKSPRAVRGAMKIIVTRGSDRDEVEVPDNASSMDVLARLCLLPDAHIVLREGVPIPIDEGLSEGDVLRVIKVASGG
jgi:sulfur carrier protein ThiS